MAFLVLANLLCVGFDVTYIAARDIYLWGQEETWVTRHYDPIKGIQPHRDTQEYLDQVDQLKVQVQQSGLQDPRSQSLLKDLRQHSLDIIEHKDKINTFEKANKLGTLEQIKNKIRKRLPNAKNSAKDAFTEFWSVDHLRPTNWQTELKFFDQEIRPLMATNYWRGIAENNLPIDKFWQFDAIFIILFGLDFLRRTLTLSRRRQNITWLDAMLWRWYDLFLFLPFWRLLRIIPVTLRLHQAGWINLHKIQVQSNRFVAENIVSEVTELALVRTISLAQASIRQGMLKQWLQTSYETVEINDVNELTELSNHVLALTINRVMPKIRPDVEQLLEHSVSEALGNLPFFEQFQQLPGVGQLPTEISKQVFLRLNQTASASINQVLADKEGQALFDQLTDNFMVALRTELQDEVTLNRIEQLLCLFLEETKQTVINRLGADDVEQTVAEISALRQRLNQA